MRPRIKPQAAAKNKTNIRRRLAAIDKAVAGLLGGGRIVAELHDGIMVTTDPLRLAYSTS